MNEIREVAVETNADSSRHPISVSVKGKTYVASILISMDEAERLIVELERYVKGQ